MHFLATRGDAERYYFSICKSQLLSTKWNLSILLDRLWNFKRGVFFFIAPFCLTLPLYHSTCMESKYQNVIDNLSNKWISFSYTRSNTVFITYSYFPYYSMLYIFYHVYFLFEGIATNNNAIGTHETSNFSTTVIASIGIRRNWI